MHTVNNVFLPKEIEYLNSVVLGPDVDWSLQPRTMKTPSSGDLDHPYLSHTMISRVGDSDPGKLNSGLWSFFEPVFHRARTSMGIDFSHVLRACLNLSWHHPWKYGVPHRDHQDTDHWNMIIYLTPITQGGTHTFTDDLVHVEETTHSLYDACAFPGLMHCQGFCAPGEIRIVAVITWR